jgi:D-alanine-D-alanine ligase
MFGDGRESLVPSILDAYKVPYVFSGPATLAVSLNKYLTKRVVRDAGVPTPDFRILSGKKDLDLEKPPFPLFVKPVSEGTGKGISNRSVIKEESEFRTVCSELIDRYHQPVLVEEYLPGREFTAGVVGTGMEARVIGVMEVCYEGDILPVYSYENKENWKGRVDYRRVDESIYDECREVTLKVWNALMARDGGRVDLRMNARGRINFIEVNPLAGLNADISDLPILARMHGITFPQLIDMIMTSAIERVFIHHG